MELRQSTAVAWHGAKAREAAFTASRPRSAQNKLYDHRTLFFVPQRTWEEWAVPPCSLMSNQPSSRRPMVLPVAHMSELGQMAIYLCVLLDIGRTFKISFLVFSCQHTSKKGPSFSGKNMWVLKPKGPRHAGAAVQRLRHGPSCIAAAAQSLSKRLARVLPITLGERETKRKPLPFRADGYLLGRVARPEAFSLCLVELQSHWRTRPCRGATSVPSLNQ